MAKTPILRSLIACAASALIVFALAGCTQQSSAQNDQQNENRQYMTQVNQKMEDLNTRLTSFTDAVSRGDVVTMRTQADNAYKTIDDLSNLDAPDALKDVKTGYVDGCNELKSALDSYIALYTDIENATDAHPFDYSTYDSRLADIQNAYNDGIDKLKAADDAAAGKN